MKVYSGKIRLNTTEKKHALRITDQVEALVHESKIQEGMVLISTGHTTASVVLSNPDHNLEIDLLDTISQIVPDKDTYKHNKGSYGKNAAAHIQSSILGSTVTLPVSKGRLALGEWQTIYFMELDGPRKRLISIKIMGSNESS